VPAFLTTAPPSFFGTLDGLPLGELLGVAASLAPHVRVELLYRGGEAGALTLADGAVVDARFGARRGLRAALAALAQQPLGFAARATDPRPSMSAWALPALLAHARALSERELAALAGDAEAWARAAPGDMRRAYLLPPDEAEDVAPRAPPWRSRRWRRKPG